MKQWLDDYVEAATIIDGGDIDYRLPTNIRPLDYMLTIRPYIGESAQYGEKAFTYDANLTVKIECMEATNKIVMHSKGLNIDATKLNIEAIDAEASVDGMYVLKSFTIDKERDFLTFTLTKECIVKKTYYLTIVYTGEITKSVFGFYRSSYTDSTGKTY